MHYLYQTERERASKLTCVSTKTLSCIKAEPGRRSSRLRSHGAIRQSLTTLTSVLCGGQLTKCTGTIRYDQLKTGFKPDTVHATSPVSSSEQAPE